MSGPAGSPGGQVHSADDAPHARPPACRRAAVFVGEEGFLQEHLPAPADADALCWRPQALAALYALQAHGYALLLLSGFAGGRAWPPGRSSGFNHALLRRMAHEADVRPAAVLAHAGPGALAPLLQEAAALHDLDLRRAWFLSSEDALGKASRRAGCRTLRLLEPAHQSRRRWPLLRGQARMKLMDAATYILRCDGHLPSDPPAPARHQDGGAHPVEGDAAAGRERHGVAGVPDSAKGSAKDRVQGGLRTVPE